MFIIGGLSGVMHASPPADLQQTDTYFVVAHFHYVLFGGSIFGLTARGLLLVPQDVRADARRGARQAPLLADASSGFNLTFFPMHFLGLQRDAAAGLHLSRGPQLRVLEPGGDRRRLRARRSRSWSSSTTSGRSTRQPGQTRAGRSVARRHAGVGDPLAAAGVQLRRGARGAQLAMPAVGPWRASGRHRCRSPSG